MSRLVFPDDGSRFTYRLEAGALKSAAGATVVVYFNEAGTVRADIRAHDGSATPGQAVANSELTVGSDSQLPLFWGPDGADELWVRVSGGPLAPARARTDNIRNDVNLALALGIAL